MLKVICLIYLLDQEMPGRSNLRNGWEAETVPYHCSSCHYLHGFSHLRGKYFWYNLARLSLPHMSSAWFKIRWTRWQHSYDKGVSESVLQAEEHPIWRSGGNREESS